MAFKFIISIVILVCVLIACDNDQNKNSPVYDYNALPTFIDSISLPSDSLPKSPLRLQMYKDTLYVLFADEREISLFSSDLVFIKTIKFEQKLKNRPISFTVTDSLIITAGYELGRVELYDRQGRFLNSFSSLPDSTTRLAPFNLTYYGGVAYVCDLGINKILAISMTDAKGITEKGELILQIPSDTGRSIGAPSAVHVTFDGRLLIGDAREGLIHTYSCDGNFIYDFDSIPGFAGITPQAFDIDRIIDPLLQDTSSFDPSGIRSMGRIHMLDSHNGAVHMFNPVGKYVATYPEDSLLKKPSGMAIDRRRHRIYIADPVLEKVVIYRYGD